MFRIFGKNLNKKHKLLSGLCSIFGIGKSRAGKVIAHLGLSPNMRINDLNPVQKQEIIDYLKEREISPSEIKKKRRDSIELLKGMRTYRGIRHKNRYPVRGQRTKTNAKTQKRIGGTHVHL